MNELVNKLIFEFVNDLTESGKVFFRDFEYFWFGW